MEAKMRPTVGFLLSELEQHLRSSKENISSQEANMIKLLKVNALRDFTVGLTGGSLLGWLGCWKLPHLLRLGTTALTGFGAGMKCFKWSLNTGADHILSLEGTRIQKEFQMMMLNRYHDVPSIMQRRAKHFYSEEVYDDTSDKPRLRWRIRNFFGEVDMDSSGTNDHDTFDEKSNQESSVVTKKINPTIKQTQTIDSEAYKEENPFDCIFGISENHEVPSSDSSNASHRRHVRAHKRSHRRHKRRHSDKDASEV